MSALDSSAPSTPLLATERLAKQYGGIRATNDVSIGINSGEVCGVIGPNGAGKSTLIGLLGGALRPSAGQILFSGKDISKLAAADRAKLGIGRTYQIPRPFLRMTVQENLLAAQYALEPWLSLAMAKRRCSEILERTKLDDAAKMEAAKLPLLRRKRLEVARALAVRPKILLLDEVGAGLIESEITELIALVRDLRSEIGGILIVEHVMRIVRECCDRLFVLNFGQVIAEGPTTEVLESDEVAAIYLGSRAASSPSPEQNGGSNASKSEVERGIAGLIGKPRGQDGISHDDAPLLEVRAVEAGYGQARVLTGVDLVVRRGEVAALVGANGAGKTTLANVISGVIAPGSGLIRFDGRDISRLDSREVGALGLSHCMEGRRIFASLSVEENLRVAARSVPAIERRKRLDAVFELFPVLAERRDAPGTAMSGGEQQQLAIGRALMARPQMVIFDEISLGLAPVMVERLYGALLQLRALRLTMLLVEQDLNRALEMADVIYVLDHGKIALSGPSAEVREDPRIRRLYVGEPVD